MPKAAKIHAELQRILSRPYTREIVRDEDGSWFARILEFPGCMTTGATDAEALVNLRDAMEAWVADALAEGEPIPDPATVEKYSGKFMVRVTRSLHRDLARRADAEGVSLNALVSTALAASVGGKVVTTMPRS